MYIIIFMGIFILFLLLNLFRLINIKTNYIVCFFITILIILFVKDIDSSIIAATNGAKLWFKAMVPTVFPFTVICNLLIAYEGIDLYSKFLGPLLCKPLKLSKNCSFPLVASFLCGYPLGAKYSTDIYELGLIDRKEYLRLLNIASNAGPLFLIGSVASALLGNITFGYILLVGNYLSIVIIGIITRKASKNINSTSLKLPKKNKTNIGDALKTSVENGISTTLSIGGFIILFSVIISIIKNSTYISTIFYNLEVLLSIPKDSLYACFLGCIEITNGCNLIATSSLSIPLKLSIISFLCSFSGFSIIAQVSSFIGKQEVPLLKYSFFKLLQGIISFFITFLLTSILEPSITTSNIILLREPSLYMYLIPVTFLIILSLILKLGKKILY